MNLNQVRAANLHHNTGYGCQYSAKRMRHLVRIRSDSPGPAVVYHSPGSVSEGHGPSIDVAHVQISPIGLDCAIAIQDGAASERGLLTAPTGDRLEHGIGMTHCVGEDACRDPWAVCPMQLASIPMTGTNDRLKTSASGVSVAQTCAVLAPCQLAATARATLYKVRGDVVNARNDRSALYGANAPDLYTTSPCLLRISATLARRWSNDNVGMAREVSCKRTEWCPAACGT
ncbi:uncharacterized protein B0H18DRAFT_1035006 [Fomitopsis serialis]|uniref:uncharacterized protein n=1 Tax=Fomitopsis serialis TaxID=139415 RepID=UPI00200875D4|nr:uncharacterized protein B0H18DRAFT_1035006 [Neoantrodia serialis]KAH9917338.1 hypothetical protein B0H18DRAFT_1035006 [Neoantrodia serialis]